MAPQGPHSSFCSISVNLENQLREDCLARTGSPSRAPAQHPTFSIPLPLSESPQLCSPCWQPGHLGSSQKVLPKVFLPVLAQGTSLTSGLHIDLGSKAQRTLSSPVLSTNQSVNNTMPYVVVPWDRGGREGGVGRGGGGITCLPYLSTSCRLGFSYSQVEPNLIRTPTAGFPNALSGTGRWYLFTKDIKTLHYHRHCNQAGEMALLAKRCLLPGLTAQVRTPGPQGRRREPTSASVF